MGSKRDAPPAPDYAAQAEAQGEANIESAIATSVLSNPNMVTPYGTRTVSYDYGAPTYSGSAMRAGDPFSLNGGFSPFGNGSGGGTLNYNGQHPVGVPTVTITDELSEAEQAKYDANNDITMSLYGTAQDSLGRVGEMMSSEFDTSEFQGYSDSSGVDLESLPGYYQGAGYKLPEVDTLTTDDLSGFGDASVGGLQSVADAVRQLGGYQLDQDRSALEADLAARGFSAGTEGYDAEMRNFGQQENDFNLQAMLRAGQEQSRINADLRAQRSQEFGERSSVYGAQDADYNREFNKRLFSHDLAERRRQQALTEQVTAANVGNMNRQTDSDIRARQLQEAQFIRQLPLSEVNALRTGGQPNMPQFQAFSGANVAPPPIMDAAMAQGNYDLAAYQARQTGGLGDLLGAGLGAAGAAGGFGNLFSMGAAT